jgi:hypothetical protein
MPKGILYVETRLRSPEHAEEYFAWYSHHLRLVVGHDGFVAARHFGPVDDDGPFVAMYEMDADVLVAARLGLRAAAEAGELPAAPAYLDDEPPLRRRLLQEIATFPKGGIVNESKAPLIRAGQVAIAVRWRDVGSDRGITVDIDVETTDAAAAPVAKLDLFEARPHWHQCRTGADDVIEPMDGDPMDFTFERLRSLPEMLRAAGQGDIAASLSEDEVALIIDRVRRAVHSLRPVSE